LKRIWQASIPAIEGYCKKLQWIVIGCAIMAVIFCGLGKVSGKRAQVLAQQQFSFSKKNIALVAVSTANIQKKLSDLNNQLTSANIELQTEKENVGKAVRKIKNLQQELAKLKSKSSPDKIVIAQPAPVDVPIEQESSPLVKIISEKENNLQEKGSGNNNSSGDSSLKNSGADSNAADSGTASSD